ncbi:MAG: ribulose-phosphate 3-epimerase [Candidatus Adiutrix sp.]|nr:ribulose-phosphate 3-epimerase [Candidatus Adiutrix sp.]
MKKIAPSILAADFTRLGEQMKAMEAAGADYHHLDMMDAHFVPNLTFGPLAAAAAKRVASIPLDVHLMLDDPLTYGPQCARLGADIVTFHYEATPHVHSVLTRIREAGAKSGLSLTPSTPVEVLGPTLNYVDLVLIMSVNPGFGGQDFIPESIDKVARLRKFLDENSGRRILVEVDGGVTDKNAAALFAAGADILVSGSYLYGAADYAAAIAALKGGV